MKFASFSQKPDTWENQKNLVAFLAALDVFKLSLGYSGWSTGNQGAITAVEVHMEFKR